LASPGGTLDKLQFQRVPADHRSRPHDSIYDLVDISAGGIRFQSEDDFEEDEDVVCHFELPGPLCFVLPAKIRRSADSQTAAKHKQTVAVEFQGLDENNRSQ